MTALRDDDIHYELCGQAMKVYRAWKAQADDFCGRCRKLFDGFGLTGNLYVTHDFGHLRVVKGVQREGDADLPEGWRMDKKYESMIVPDTKTAIGRQAAHDIKALNIQRPKQLDELVSSVVGYNVAMVFGPRWVRQMHWMECGKRVFVGFARDRKDPKKATCTEKEAGLKPIKMPTLFALLYKAEQAAKAEIEHKAA